jgi:hypothetical protein
MLIVITDVRSMQNFYHMHGIAAICILLNILSKYAYDSYLFPLRQLLIKKKKKKKKRGICMYACIESFFAACGLHLAYCERAPQYLPRKSRAINVSLCLGHNFSLY